MDYDTYVPTERVRAAQARKPEQVVTSAGVVTIPRYAYVVEHKNSDEFGNESTSVEIMSMEDFNDKYHRLDWRSDDRDNAATEGYERGWTDAVKYYNIAAGVVRDEIPPVGDKLETDGPVSTREDDDNDDDAGADVPTDVPSGGRHDAAT